MPVTSKTPTINDLLTEYLGPPQPMHPAGRRGNWWDCPFCRNPLALTCDPFDDTWLCVDCPAGGDAADFVSRLLSIDRQQAIARCGLKLLGEKDEEYEKKKLQAHRFQFYRSKKTPAGERRRRERSHEKAS